MNRILVIRLSAIGDVILTTPLIRMVKQKFPNVSVDFLVKAAYVELLESHPLIRQVIPFHSQKGHRELFRIIKYIRQNKYDAVIDLQKNLRSFLLRSFSRAPQVKKYHHQRWKRFLWVHCRKNFYKKTIPVPLRYLNALKGWDVKDDNNGLELFPTQSSKMRIDQLLFKHGIKKKENLVVLAPGASYTTKRWPEDRYAQIGDSFYDKGFRVLLLGGPGDIKICKKVVQFTHGDLINLAGQLSLGESMALLSRTDLLVTNDTGIMHMGSALSKHVIALFGPTTSHLGFFPFRTSSEVVQKDMPCRPCSYHGTEKCPKDHFLCMLDIDAHSVLDAASVWSF